jgi:hypothetical protein
MDAFMINSSAIPNYKTIPLSVVGSNNFGRYPKISSEQTFNMFISDGAMVPYAGYRDVSSQVLSGEARQIFLSEKFQQLIIVFDENVYAVNKSLAIYQIGRLATSSGDIYIAENEATQIAIVDGLYIYVYDWMASVFTQTTVDFMPVYISYQDGRFLAADGSSNQWRLSDFMPLGGLSWPADAGHVGELQTKPDYTKAVIPFGKELLVFGRTVTQIHYDVGYTLFPYSEDNYFCMDFGCINSATIATGSLGIQISAAQTEKELVPIIAWVGVNKTSGPVIMYSTGGPPRQISDDGINLLLENLSFPEKCYGFIYKIGGHTFYHITFYDDNLSLVYDFHEQRFFTLTDENLNYHIAKNIAFFNNAYYFVSINDAKLYQLSSDFDDCNGKQMQRFRTMPNLRLPDSSPFVLQNINVTLEQGNTNESQRIDLSLSVDGGESWGTIQGEELNTMGKRQNKLDFWNLGMSNDVTPRLHFVGRGRFVIIGGVATIYQ